MSLIDIFYNISIAYAIILLKSKGVDFSNAYQYTGAIIYLYSTPTRTYVVYFWMLQRIRTVGSDSIRSPAVHSRITNNIIR